MPNSSLLVYNKGVQIMFGAGAKALFAKYGRDICLYLNKYLQMGKVNFLSALSTSFKLPLTNYFI